MSRPRPTVADLPALRKEADESRRRFEEAKGAAEEAKSAWYSAEDRLHDALGILSVCTTWECDGERMEDSALCADCRMQWADNSPKEAKTV